MPHRLLKASGRHMNAALPRIKALASILCNIAAGALRYMQHDSNGHLGSCCHESAAEAARDMQHDSSNRAAGMCEGGRGLGAKEHDLDPQRTQAAYWPHSIWLQPWSHLQSFGGGCFTKGWRDFQILSVSDDASPPFAQGSSGLPTLALPRM